MRNKIIFSSLSVGVSLLAITSAQAVSNKFIEEELAKRETATSEQKAAVLRQAGHPQAAEELEKASKTVKLDDLVDDEREAGEYLLALGRTEILKTELAATVYLKTILGIQNLHLLQITATVDLRAGRAGLTPIENPRDVQVGCAAFLTVMGMGDFTNANLAALEDLVARAGNLGIVANAITAEQVKAASHLKNIRGLENFNDHQLAATVDLMTTRNGFAAIAAPTEAEVNAVAYLRGVAALRNFTNAQLAATVDLIAGRVGVLTAIAAPTDAQVNAAAYLRGVAALRNFTNAQLAATVDLMTGRDNLPAIAAPTEAQVDAADYLLHQLEMEEYSSEDLQSYLIMLDPANSGDPQEIFYPSSEQLEVVVSAYEAGADVQKALALSYQNGFGAKDPDNLPLLVMRCIGSDDTHHDFEIVWQDQVTQPPVALTATPARLAGGTTFKIPNGEVIADLEVGDLVVASQLQDHGTDAVAVQLVDGQKH